MIGRAVDVEIPRACVSDENQKLPFCNTSLSTTERVEDLLARLPLGEKAILLTARASPRGNMTSIGLPEYNWGANCVHGVQSTCGTNCPTSFPNPVNMGAIFDPEAVREMAQVIGWEEALTSDWTAGHPTLTSTETLAGGAIPRHRLQEGKREDSRYLQAVVTLKHYIAYSYENYGGGNRKEFDAIVSPYDFADTYFPAFRSSIVDGNATGVMCSYNSINGVPTCANNADSGAIEAISDRHHYVATRCEAARIAILAGTDVNSGRLFGYMKCLPELVRSNQLEEKALDDALRHTLKLRFELGLFDPIDDQPYWHVKPSDVNTPKSRQLALNLATKSIVLLQNNNSVLPLRKGTKLAVLGPHAESKRGLLGNYLGQMCHGGYSEVGCIQTPMEAVSTTNGAATSTYALGCNISGNSTDGFEETKVKVTQEADAVVLFLGIDTSIEEEVNDRNDIKLPSIQMQLLQRVRAVGKPTVVVLINGGVLGAEDLILQTDALVEAFYPGFFGAQAMADVLFGDANPNGKLPYEHDCDPRSFVSVL
ncbi:glycoside hydrolase, putative [Phytophthora infestans T30-4]|uniref:Glycoside hydrolase, putative n=1 Tax=Phytophthora infestans (strain T30-4) TaxID=403677 RepID=D0NTT5_PHYIT|nr:glycoside hydrolase, putative [Phytophthora infestans T30-4]EEY65047.1 glycoside hydrolase, putative [Phytophthora infestans T30-4]|eukprot:XP_002897535.1 glycoside hydrolase, putative [Phytophthora infestans T30-4]